ncbi:hypothetical protein ASG31_00230 [Chryseobacterium sp. Leaf404]|nr:hypothetical protein ASG31_00230 [Chryseobacterium sp. Leaf404]
MKFLPIAIVFLFLNSCQKEKTETSDQTVASDSLTVNEQASGENAEETAAVRMKDSMINNAPKTKEVLETGVMREEKDRVIIRMADGQRTPITIGEKFTEKHDKLILKITDFSKPQIKASIKVKDSKQNIRINQIKMPDGSMDGPFGKDLVHDVKGKGEVWIIIGKNNMADGATVGDFSVTVE